jgi:3'-5' exoribonuclease
MNPRPSPKPLVSLADHFAQLQDENWTGFIALKSAERKVAKNGSPYLRATVSDGTNTIAWTIFDSRPGFKEIRDGQWKVGDHFKVSGKIKNTEQWGRQIEVDRIRPIDPQRDPADGYRPEAFFESAPIALDAAWREIQEAIASLQPPELQNTVADLINSRESAFRSHAAAKSAHHAYHGGLLQHTTMILRAAKALMAVQDFPPVNASLVIAGILLHDLGKTVELEAYPRSEYTETGALLGHAQIVLQWLTETAPRHQLVGPVLLHLQHIILSHHGEHEFGAAVLPQTKEAVLVNLLDNLDAKMAMVHYALNRMEPGTLTTEKLWALDNRTFRPSPPSP